MRSPVHGKLIPLFLSSLMWVACIGTSDQQDLLIFPEGLEFDLGNVAANSPVRLTLPYELSSQDDVSIENVKADCSCMSEPASDFGTRG